jgi:hypothetical protein
VEQVSLKIGESGVSETDSPGFEFFLCFISCMTLNKWVTVECPPHLINVSDSIN